MVKSGVPLSIQPKMGQRKAKVGIYNTKVQTLFFLSFFSLLSFSLSLMVVVGLHP